MSQKQELSRKRQEVCLIISHPGVVEKDDAAFLCIIDLYERYHEAFIKREAPNMCRMPKYTMEENHT